MLVPPLARSLKLCREQLVLFVENLGYIGVLFILVQLSLGRCNGSGQIYVLLGGGINMDDYQEFGD